MVRPFTRFRPFLSVLGIIVLIFVGFQSNNVRADQSADAGKILEGLFGLAIGATQIQAAKKSWQKVDEEVQQCLIDKYKIYPAQLARNGIKATDRRVVPYIQECQRKIAQAQFEQQQKIQAEERARQEKMAAEQAELERLEARKKMLTEKYGAEAADAIMNGRVLVGMSREEVIEARGNPDRVMKVPPSDEMWSYGSDRIILIDGKVSSVETRSTSLLIPSQRADKHAFGREHIS